MCNIGVVIGNLNKEHGGAQQLLFDICRHLPESMFDTTVYYMFGEGTYAPQFETHGTAVIDLDASSNYDPAAFHRLVNNLRTASHDILQTNSPISGCWGRTAAKVSGVPNIVSVEHNVHVEYAQFTRVVNGLTLPLADAVVGVSEAVSDSYLGWEEQLLGDAARRVTIRNGVDIERIRETFGRADDVLTEYTPFSPSDFIIGTMGRLHEQKGYKYLIRGFPEIKRQCSSAKLLIIGDGPERETLQAIADDIEYSEEVYFTGYVPSVYPFVPSFDIAVFPSVWEGFGLTPVESMAAKRPVVGTKIPPFREIIGSAGLLVEPKDELKLAEGVISLAKDPTRREKLGEKGYERAVEHFSIERTVEEYADLYRELAHE